MLSIVLRLSYEGKVQFCEVLKVSKITLQRLNIIFKRLPPGLGDPARCSGPFSAVALLNLNVSGLTKLFKLYAKVSGGGGGLLPQIDKVGLLKRNEQRNYCQPQLRME